MIARQIFKAKTDAGTLVTGSLLCEGDTWYIQDDIALYPIARSSAEVFTGRTDRWNRLIFTGDTVRWHGQLWQAVWSAFFLTYLLRSGRETVPLASAPALELELCQDLEG